VTDAARSKVDWSYAWGPLSAFGLVVAVVTGIVDQASKFWLLHGLHIDNVAPVAVAPFLDLVLTWNTGISYGLFPQQGRIGPWALLAFKIVAVVFLWSWLCRVHTRLTALALGMIIGGAVGNAVDRLHWPGVMDFVLLHAEVGGRTFRWYVFNLADVAIVAGVVGLLYESVRHGGAAKAP
jgi:signal peptidase II